MQERVKFIAHEGKEILAIDLSHASLHEVLAAVEYARGVIAAQPRNSLRTLTNVEGIRYRREMSELLRDFALHNKPYVRAGAVVGLDGLKMIIFNFINRVTGRALRAVDDERAALEWLSGV